MQTDWFETFFQDVAVDLWRELFPWESSAKEVDFIESELRLPEKARVLDVPCGHGRHSIALALRGHAVAGVDLSKDALAWAQKDAACASVEVDWLRRDMRQPPAGPFDGAICLGNSFGYLTPFDARCFLRAVRDQMKPGGRAVLDLSTCAEALLPSLQNNRWYKVGETFMLSQNQYVAEEGRLDIEYTFLRDGRSSTRYAASYIMTLSEVRRMAAEEGWFNVAAYCSIQREPVTRGKPVLLVLENPATSLS